MTNYAVVRLQRDIGRRAGVGLLGTAVDPAAHHACGQRLRFPAARIVVGADGYFFLDARSRLGGQRISRRQPRRPDPPRRSHGCSSRRSGTTSGPMRLISRSIRTPRASVASRAGSTSIATAGWCRSTRSLWGVSPGFESNDLGFHDNGDRGGAHGVIIWRNVTPGRVLRDRHDLGGQVRGPGTSTASCRATASDVQANVDVPELLVRGRTRLQLAAHAGRSPDARRPDRDRAPRRVLDLNGWHQYRRAQMVLAQHSTSGCATTTRAAGAASLGVTFNLKPSASA